METCDHFHDRQAIQAQARGVTIIRPASTGEDIAIARTLFGEYAAWLGVDLGFQGFSRELAGLPGAYAPPRGRLLLAAALGQDVGCVAARPVSNEVCEMKRLFVRPQARRHGVARLLVAEIIAWAGRAGYETMVLDTLNWMHPAIALYESFGFERTAPYYDNPLPGAVYFRLRLDPFSGGVNPPVSHGRGPQLT